MSIPNAINCHEEPVASAGADVSAPAANTSAVVTYAAGGAGVQHCIGGIAWSYNNTPTGGNLLVQDGATTILSLDITAGGPGYIQFVPPKKGTANQALTVTLAAAGASVSGKVSILGHWTEGPSP
jgi:hypothetical protein